MKHGMNPRRHRNGRNNGGKRSFGPSNNRSYESNGPDVKVRGTANQIFDKYLALARDATVAGDRISAEAYYQHAEHYYRMFTGTIDGPRQQGPRSNDPSMPPSNDPSMPPTQPGPMQADQARDDSGGDYNVQPQHNAAPETQPH